jgi:putative DNA primase/helicase
MPKVEDWKASQMVAHAQKDAAKKALDAAAKKKTSADELKAMAREIVTVPEEDEPSERRYLVNDCSVEKLGELLAANPTGLTWFRDELIGLLKTLEREGHQSDRGFLLESWSGLNSYTFDRILRGTIYIPSCCLSIFGTIQPGPLARYLRSALAGEECDGFIPRYQILLHPDPPAGFENIDRWPDTEAKNRAYGVFRAIDQLDATKLKCEVDPDRGIPFVRFSDAAQQFFTPWREGLEKRLRSGTLSSVMAIHLAKFRSLLPALAEQFHLIASCPPVQSDGTCKWERLEPVSLEAAEMAAAWCELLEAHAARVYRCAMDGDIDAAVTLDERLRIPLPNPFTCWQVAQKGWKGLGTVEEVRSAVSLLASCNRVQIVEVPPTERGGRPGEQVWIHPTLRLGEEVGA